MNNLYRTDTEALDECLRLMFPSLEPEAFRTDGGNINMPKVRSLWREQPDMALMLLLCARFGLCVGKDHLGGAYVGRPGTKDVILTFTEGSGATAELLAVIRAIAAAGVEAGLKPVLKDRLKPESFSESFSAAGVALPAPAQRLRTALDLTLTNLDVCNIAAFATADQADDDEAVRLLIGDGHSGYGLYAASPEYQEEGAVFIKALPDPTGVDLPDQNKERDRGA